MGNSHTQIIQVKNLDVPIKLIREWRNSVRISIVRDCIHLRLPRQITSSKQIQQNLRWAENWVNKQFTKNPELKDRFTVKSYLNDQIFHINEQQFQLKITEQKRKTNRASIHQNTIHLLLDEDLDAHSRGQVISTLLSRVCGQYFLPKFKSRVQALNQRYFKEEIGHIRLKHNKSNWGSCSIKRNLNFSTRLLFAPGDVQDYVILHELAHLVELNHSKIFWNILERIDPQYKDKEMWLKQNAYRCQF